MMSLETEINVHVIGCTEHIEIFRIKRLVSLITFILVLQPGGKEPAQQPEYQDRRL